MFTPADNVGVMYGIHPHFITATYMEDLVLLRQMLHENYGSIIALGEIGLDFGPKNTVNIDLQIEGFLNQLKIAVDRDLPICLHIRGDQNDIAFKVLDDANVPLDQKIHLHW